MIIVVNINANSNGSYIVIKTLEKRAAIYSNQEQHIQTWTEYHTRLFLFCNLVGKAWSPGKLNILKNNFHHISVFLLGSAERRHLYKRSRTL